jgi:hypothetical protein
MSNTVNIAGLASNVAAGKGKLESIKNNLDASKIADMAIEKGKQMTSGPVQQVLNDIEAAKKKYDDLKANTYDKFNDLDKRIVNKSITREEADRIKGIVQGNFEEEEKDLKEFIDKKTEQYTKLVENSKESIRNKLKAADEKVRGFLKKSHKRAKRKNGKILKDLLKGALKAAKKNPVPAIMAALTITCQLVSVRNKKIEELVDSVNNVIDNIQSKEDVKKATLLRNNAIRIIRENEAKINSIKGTLERIALILSILDIILFLADILLPIPVPSPAPDVVTPSKEKFRKKYELAVEIITSLIAAIAIIGSLLDRIIEELEDQKERLKEIDTFFDEPSNLAAFDRTDLDKALAAISPSGNFGDLDTGYKGFRFALKEENDSKFTVAGNKRRYAVALNRDGNEVLQSSRSFTLDPDILIEELKLIIDQQNLKP